LAGAGVVERVTTGKTVDIAALKLLTMKLAGYGEYPVAPVMMVPSDGVALSSGLLLLRRTRKNTNNRTTMAARVPPIDAPTMSPTGVEEEDPDEWAADVAPAE
jgi:hypothetical protein